MLNKDIKLLLNFVSKKYNISYDILLTELNDIQSNTSLEKYNKNKCHAYIMVDGIKKQCSRSKNTDNFCLTHFKQNQKNVLKYGKIDILTKKKKPVINKKNEKIFKNPIQVEYLTINDIDYLYNPSTKCVYDFDTKKKIGKLDNDMNIIKKHKF